MKVTHTCYLRNSSFSSVPSQFQNPVEWADTAYLGGYLYFDFDLIYFSTDKQCMYMVELRSITLYHRHSPPPPLQRHVILTI